MRTLPVIAEAWKRGGPFRGDLKPTTRVTVQQPWPDLAGDPVRKDDFLRTTGRHDGLGVSSSRGWPCRWFQRADNSQGEKEIPNIASVSVDRSIDQDAASFNLTLSNQWMYTNAGAKGPRVGQSGYFTPTRGDSKEARARWGHEQNEWNNVLVPNAVIRIYTGFGGGTGPIATAVANGNLALYGVFLVDETRVNSRGQLVIVGRDVAKLLIDQQLFPPLVPSSEYPLTYERWHHRNVNLKIGAKQITTGSPNTAGVTGGEKRTVYRDSSADRWYGSNASIHGHRGTDSVDGNPGTYALSVGNSRPERPFCTDWWEYDVGEAMNAVHLTPWRGGYVMYVSVWEDSGWQTHPDPPSDDGGVIPYDPSALFGTQPRAGDTGANIPYVAKFMVPHGEGQDYVLPRAYMAHKFRVTFRNHVDSGIGVWRYRCGIAEVRAKGVESAGGAMGPSTTTGLQTTTYLPYVAAADSYLLADDPNATGYITASSFDQIDAFGDARRKPKGIGAEDLDDGITAIRFTKTGKGYWVLNARGSIRAHGDAVWMGDPAWDGFIFGETNGYAWDIAVTHTGEGYWVLTTNGKVYEYGDAPEFGPDVNVPPDFYSGTSSITAHPSAYGYWILRGQDGSVHARGAATHYGKFPPLQKSVDTEEFSHEVAACIRATSTGQGYWILSSHGRVEAFGDAKKFGQPHRLAEVGPGLRVFTDCYWELLPAPLDAGYLLVHASGQIVPFGDVIHFGNAVPGGKAILRSDGDYKDYADIIKDLVRWSGFLLYDPALPRSAEAPVYGSIETTGAFAKDKLPDDIFDKRPVIDAITTIKEVVGYLVWVDTEGRFRFESPNWWRVGNYNEDGHHIELLPEVDEQVQLTDYAVSTADDPLRSSILISSHDPYADLEGTLSFTYTPPGAERLRGIVKPAMWINDYLIDPVEQRLMAELIGLHIAFQQRVGQVDCVASPHIELNDQVRIYERQTEEVFVHYVRGINFSHNLDTGDYRMTLTTHWVAAGSDSEDIIGGEVFGASEDLKLRILAQQFGKLVKDPGGRI